MDPGLIAVGAMILLGVIILAKTAVVVPQQSQYIVERLGKYAGTLDAGFHILVPFLDIIRYRHSLKEAATDIPEQICITSDNVCQGRSKIRPEQQRIAVLEHKLQRRNEILAELMDEHLALKTSMGSP